MESTMLKFQWKLQESKKLWSKLSAASDSGGGHVLFLCICIWIFLVAYLYLYICICVFCMFYLLEESEKLWQNLSGCLSSVTNFIERQIAVHQTKAPQAGLTRKSSKNIIFWIFIETESCFIQCVEWSFFIWAVKPFWVWKIALLLLIFLHLKKTPLCRIFTIFWASV